MRFNKYLKEDSISKALDIEEPEVGQSYPDEKIKRYIEIIDKALNDMSSKKESDANDSIVADLRDKKKKWKNVKKETKPVKTKLDIPPDQQDQQQEEPPPEQPPEQKQESRFMKLDKFLLS